jgi:hypothetical protein
MSPLQPCDCDENPSRFVVLKRTASDTKSSKTTYFCKEITLKSKLRDGAIRHFEKAFSRRKSELKAGRGTVALVHYLKAAS